MKLNNHGWGLREMILLTLALLLFLGIIVYLIVIMKNKDEDVPIDVPIIGKTTSSWEYELR